MCTKLGLHQEKRGRASSGPSEEKKKQLREERIKRLLQEARKHCGNDQECISNYVGKRIAYDQMGKHSQLKGLIGFSKLIGAITGGDPFFRVSQFWIGSSRIYHRFNRNHHCSLCLPSPWGNDAGQWSHFRRGFVASGKRFKHHPAGCGDRWICGSLRLWCVRRGHPICGAKLAQSTLSPFIQKWLPKIIGGGSGGVADQSAFDWLRDRKLMEKCHHCRHDRHIDPLCRSSPRRLPRPGQTTATNDPRCLRRRHTGNAVGEEKRSGSGGGV